MTRTQISLETSQYDFVKSDALARGLSISAVVRELIAERMAMPSGLEAQPVSVLAGLIQDGTVTGAEHDRLLAAALARKQPAVPGE